MVDCPNCDNPLAAAKLDSMGRWHHSGDTGCNQVVPTDTVEENEDAISLVDPDGEPMASVDDVPTDDGSPDSDPEPASTEPDPRGPPPQSPSGAGRADRYSQRVQDKTERVVDWVNGGPVGVDPDSAGAEDFIQRLRSNPEITEDARTLQEWIDSYFTQVPRPAREDLFKELEGIDARYERSGEMFEDVELGRREQKEQTDDSGDDGGLDEERLVKLFMSAQQTQQSQEEKQASTAMTEARDKMILELGDEASESLGSLRDIAENWKGFAQNILLQEMQENPQFRREMIKQFFTNPAIQEIFERGDGDFNAEQLLSGDGGGGGGDGSAEEPGGGMAGMMGGMGGGPPTDSNPPTDGGGGMTPDDRVTAARQSAEQSQSSSSPGPSPPPESERGATDEQNTQSEGGMPSSGTNPMSASPDDTSDLTSTEDTDTGGASEDNNDEEVLSDFSDL